MKVYNCFINNKWVKPETGKWFYSENPANAENWAKVPDCNYNDVNNAVKSAKRHSMTVSGVKFLQLKEADT